METKYPWQSKTYVGLAVTILGVLLNNFHVKWLDEAQLNEVASAVCEVVGLVMAAYGRYKATTAVTLTPKP